MESIKNILKRIECNTLLATKTVLTVDDVATLTGLSKSHIYKLTYSHQIPHYKPSGKQVYFEKESGKQVRNHFVKDATNPKKLYYYGDDNGALVTNQ